MGAEHRMKMGTGGTEASGGLFWKRSVAPAELN